MMKLVCGNLVQAQRRYCPKYFEKALKGALPARGIASFFDTDDQPAIR
jgi:hypothetical protein